MVYQERFSADFLNLFMKSMEKQTIYMTVAPDRPLILHYNLGAYKSWVSLAGIAPGLYFVAIRAAGTVRHAPLTIIR